MQGWRRTVAGRRTAQDQPFGLLDNGNGITAPVFLVLLEKMKIPLNHELAR